MHESSLHANSSFITLTYNDKNLPKGGSITPYDFQCFIKRFRKELYPQKIRYLHCGEYGPKLGRPHYHALIFGYHFPDRLLYKEKPFKWYRSAQLERLWPFGYSTVCDLTAASAAYVARYTLKKSNGLKVNYGDKHPEYITMSRKPGIGAGWYDRYKQDIYPEGVLYSTTGVKQSPPKFYDRRYQLENHLQMAKIKLARAENARHNTVTDVLLGTTRLVSNSDSFRLPVRERVKLSQLQSLSRKLGGHQ